ncbi:hypothetical protein ONE63_001385 [Megalurothrips usitatus]|uniref:Uncharacterized protein n=1 Tax=Megalurothrips usitatus TaxID=439358 RepID=A0AAV7XFR5_9NEOP|nr:hypothetical protein ONE63_001385 [Megalurothrips usitatus]
MKNSAFAFDPCPRDLLGKQWLFMHMSAHYRRMWSAQSVVDSAPPASLKTLKRPAGATPRSSSRPVRLGQKPSRADTDPGHAHGHGLHGRVQGRPTAPSQRQLDYGHGPHGAPRKPASLVRQRRRDQEASGTYFDKLNQLVPDQLPQRSAPRTTGQFLSEVFTPRVPHKPQVLKTEVPSRLKFSSSYCPPRPKTLRSKLGVPGQEISRDAEQPIWISSRSSPPVSSRDSAYNGGISSGGESRGPTPDHKGNRKHAKRSERKSRKKVDNKRPHSADAKTRRKLESKLRKKLVESERNEIHEQRLRVDPWNEVKHDDHGDEILRNINDLQIDSRGDDSLTEQGSPVNTGSASDESVDEDLGGEADELVDEDVADEADEAVEVDSTQDDVDDVLTKDGDESSIQDESSASAESVKTQPPSKTASLLNKQQAGTQTEIQALSKSSSDVHSISSRSIHSPSETTQTSRTTAKQSSSHHSSGASHISTQLPSKPSLREAEEVPQFTQLDIMGQTKTSTALSKSLQNEPKSQTMEPRPNITQSNNASNDMINGVSYKKLVRDITEDLIKNGIVTDRGFKVLSQEHMQANSKLDRTKMKEEINKLHAQLEIPWNDYLSRQICEDNLQKKQSTFLSEVKQTSPLLSPLVSAPSDILISHDLEDKAQPKLFPNQATQFKPCLFPLASPLKSTELGGMSTKRYSGVLDSENEPIISEEGQNNHKNPVNSYLWPINQVKDYGFNQFESLSNSVFTQVEKVPSSYSNDTSSLIDAEFNQKANVSGHFDLHLKEKETIEEVMKPDYVQKIISPLTVPEAVPNANKPYDSFKSLASIYDMELRSHLHDPYSLSPTTQESIMNPKASSNLAFLDAQSNHNSSCFCNELSCKCASLGHMEEFFQESWMNGQPTTPFINSKICSEANEVASKNLEAGDERKGDRKKMGCKCNKQVVADKPEIVTIFKKTGVLKNYSEVSSRVGGFLVEQEISKPEADDAVTDCVTVKNLIEDPKIATCGAIENSAFTEQSHTSILSVSKFNLENLSSNSVGTGINSDIRQYIKSLEKES